MLRYVVQRLRLDVHTVHYKGDPDKYSTMAIGCDNVESQEIGSS